MERKWLKNGNKSFSLYAKGEGNREVSIPISLKYATQIIIIICL